MNCSTCKDFELYHDCDDPIVLPNHRMIKNKNNCSVWLASGSCVYENDSKKSMVYVLTASFGEYDDAYDSTLGVFDSLPLAETMKSKYEAKIEYNYESTKDEYLELIEKIEEGALDHDMDDATFHRYSALQYIDKMHYDFNGCNIKSFELNDVTRVDLE